VAKLAAVVHVFKNGRDDVPHMNTIQLSRYGRYRSTLWTYAGCNTFRKGTDGGRLQRTPREADLAPRREGMMRSINKRAAVMSPSTLVLGGSRSCFGGYFIGLNQMCR
jgi:hypothetical protein